jgi:hypothetical protein
VLDHQFSYNFPMSFNQAVADVAFQRCDVTDRDRSHPAMPVLAAPNRPTKGSSGESRVCLGLRSSANCVVQAGLRWVYFRPLQEDLRAR